MNESTKKLAVKRRYVRCVDARLFSPDSPFHYTDEEKSIWRGESSGFTKGAWYEVLGLERHPVWATTQLNVWNDAGEEVRVLGYRFEPLDDE